ncbi:uncharacterized protein ASCRUDRAFT_76225 [Ascoidea rubescens DSM 1968]|uniref:Prolyl 4-hydroxylase alpha subunit domain-containing protein n=1 Tax=Ascoidea rubescens DSM 1968 TaxID=1344418 RepID=A0A1D2VHA7_9ASCO|nr:hypothetical protein ASCRUDRAFT_76225 [Ascoidea rubescens DSM 1968]ODV60867.1 hypothetical protein ASCRUDRAFT_76225 [Ascoidea rubescens DSM 1968]
MGKGNKVIKATKSKSKSKSGKTSSRNTTNDVGNNSNNTSNNTSKDGYEFPSNVDKFLRTRMKDNSYFNINKYKFKYVISPSQIVIIENFFIKEYCDEIILSINERLKFLTTPLVKNKNYARRNNDRIVLDHSYQLSGKLYGYLKKIVEEHDVEMGNNNESEMTEFFKGSIGFNPQIRIYRYSKNQFFEKHYDESVKCSVLDSEKSKVKGKTKWTLLIYLTGDEEIRGGGTMFYDPENSSSCINVHPKKGMALFHKHGDDCLLHEAERVHQGEKWVLRTDLVFPL